MDVIKGITPYTPEEAGYDAKRLEVVDNVYKKLIQKERLQCASYALSLKGKLFAVRSMGRMHYDENDGRLCQPDSIRRIASITKLFTAVGIMKLVEDGEIEIQQPVCEVLKEFDNNLFKDVKIMHLLNHTSGVCMDMGAKYEPYGTSWWDLINHEDSKLNWIEAALSKYPACKPGGEWVYCSTGFAMLGEIIHRVTGVKAEPWIEQNIFKPLSMEDSYFDVPREKWDRIICVQTWDNPKDREAAGNKEEGPYIPSTGGGIYSTLYDLIKFGQMLAGGGIYNGVRVISRKTIEKMTQETTGGAKNFCWGATGQPRYYGLGPDLVGLNESGVISRETYGHEGAGRSFLQIDPKEGFVAAAFVPTNKDWVPESLINARSVMWSGII